MARGDGETTRQMMAAPAGAYFVWCNNTLHYPKSLAVQLKRDDLKIVSPEWLDPMRVRGLRVRVVIDHAAYLTPRQCEAVDYLRSVMVQFQREIVTVP